MPSKGPLYNPRHRDYEKQRAQLSFLNSIQRHSLCVLCALLADAFPKINPTFEWYLEARQWAVDLVDRPSASNVRSILEALKEYSLEYLDFVRVAAVDTIYFWHCFPDKRSNPSWFFDPPGSPEIKRDDYVFWRDIIHEMGDGILFVSRDRSQYRQIDLSLKGRSLDPPGTFVIHPDDIPTEESIAYLCGIIVSNLMALRRERGWINARAERNSKTSPESRWDSLVMYYINGTKVSELAQEHQDRSKDGNFDEATIRKHFKEMSELIGLDLSQAKPRAG